jgi:predicted kinase
MFAGIYFYNFGKTIGVFISLYLIVNQNPKMKQPSEPKIGNSSSSPKRLIVMCGLPGAGKTTTAHRIRQALGDAIVFSRDFVRGKYKDDMETIDRIYYEDVENLLPFFSTIILDATFKKSGQRQFAFDFARKQGCQLFLIECICDNQTLLDRLQRQVQLGHKKFNGPLEKQLERYINSMQKLQKQLLEVNFIQLNTETNRVISRSLQDHSFHFANYLVEILERPFEPLVPESFVPNIF